MHQMSIIFEVTIFIIFYTNYIFSTNCKSLQAYFRNNYKSGIRLLLDKLLATLNKLATLGIIKIDKLSPLPVCNAPWTVTPYLDLVV